MTTTRCPECTSLFPAARIYVTDGETTAPCESPWHAEAAAFIKAADGMTFRREEDGMYTMWCHDHWDTIFPGLWSFSQVTEGLGVEIVSDPEASE